MSSDYRPQTEIDDSEFRDMILPSGRPPGSLTDLQYIYGMILSLGHQSTDKAAGDNYSPYLTPMEASAVRGQEQGIVYLDVKLNRKTKTLTPIGSTVVTGTDEHIDRCAFSAYSAGNGVDHSITQKTSKNGGIDPEKTTYKDFSYISENKLGDVTATWPGQDHVQQVAEEHPDGWIIRELSELPTVDGWDEIKSDLEAELTVDDTKGVTRLVSVRFFESADPVDELDTVTLQDPGQWLYPADIDVLLEAMKAQRTGKFRTKNQQDALGKGDASGRAAGYVRSEQVQDVYGQGDIPLSLTTGKKRAWMPNLNRGQSTTAHPFTGETLSVVSKSEPILDGCKQSAGLSIYHFPYFAGEQTVEKMRYLYTLMWDAYQQSERDKESDSDDGGRITTTPIQRFYKRLTDEVEAENPSEEDSIADTLRFWTINIVHYQDKRKRAIAEAAGMSALRAVDVAQTATSVATDLSNSRLFQTYPSWDFTNPETDFLAQITSPYYFITTTVTTTDEDEVDANEPGYAFYQQLLRDEPISLSQLLEAYVSHIDDRYDQSANDGRRLPTLQIIEQFAQLATLGRSGLLEVDIPSVSDTVDPYAVPVETDEQSTDTITDTMTDEDDNPDDNDKGDSKPTPKERAIAEKEAYNRMITEQPVLSESPSRRAVFTLGSLITTVSGYQAAKGTKPLNSRLNPTTITKHNIQEYVTDVLEQINTYATAEGGNNIWKYETQTSQLAEDLTVKPVAEWELSSADIQYHLSLGMAFGAQRHD